MSPRTFGGREGRVRALGKSPLAGQEEEEEEDDGVEGRARPGLQRRAEACCPHPARAAGQALSPQTCRTAPIARGSPEAPEVPEPL